MAEAGIYPAIDVEASISRLCQITTEEQQEQARLLKECFATTEQTLISVGAY